MKLGSLVRTACALALLLSTACDDATSRDADVLSGGSGEARYDGSGSFGFRAAAAPDDVADVRSRADEAFAELERLEAGADAGTTERFDSRVGPQAWPSDLPSHWPIPDSGQLLADTRHERGERLLLVDLPGSPDRALDAYRDALRGAGFEVENGQVQSARRALFARRGEEQAVLTFAAGETATRLEILFVRPASG